MNPIVRRRVTLGCMQKSIRFPDDLAERIQAEADELDRSFSWVVLNAVRSELSKGKRWTDGPMPQEKPSTSVEVHGKSVTTTARLRCPSSGCTFEATSPAARCPRHGRTVK